MRNLEIKSLYPHIIAIAIFIAVTLLYLYPVLQGKQIQAHDTSTSIAMQKEINDYKDKTDGPILWTNIMFSGMPTYLIGGTGITSLITYVDQLTKNIFPYPLTPVFLYMLGFYILMIIMKVNPWLSIAGSLAFAFSTYFLIILEAGHYTKAFAIAYMAPTLAGVILIYRKKLILGGILTAFFTALEIYSNHVQITYYLGIIIMLYVLAELIKTLKNKEILKDFSIATSVLLIAGLIGILVNSNKLWMTYEYTKYSTRGKSELTMNKDNQTSGLDRDYATSWSYGIPETMTLLVPGMYGGASGASLGENSATYEVLKKNNVPNAKNYLSGLPLYWGPQPFTSGPVYVGAMIFFLFFLGLLVSKGHTRWWILASVILAVLLAWGKHLMWFTNFFFDFIPMYNKFRAVSMILVIAELLMPLLAILTLQQIIDKKIDRKELLNKAKILFYIIGGILAVMALFGGSLFSFSGAGDMQYGLPDWFLDALKQDRQKMLQMDAFRSLVFVGLTFGIIWLLVKEKIKLNYIYLLLSLLIIADLWFVNKRYLNNDDFVSKKKVEVPYTPTPADNFILQDKELYYRVFNLNEDLDKSSRTSYFHKNIGGYHGAKMERYQELINLHLQKERMELGKELSEIANQAELLDILSNMDVLNMLNVKYIIYDDKSNPIVNPLALGNAWFVEDFKVVNNADEEITELGNIDTKKQALVDQRFSTMIGGFTPSFDSTGMIRLTSYDPNKLTYTYSANSDQFTIFSDIYYDKGWKAYIDGKLTPHFRANYVLRGMILPAGDHDLEFRFEPESYYTSKAISMASSSALLLVILAAIVLNYFKRSKPAVPEKKV